MLIKKSINIYLYFVVGRYLLYKTLKQFLSLQLNVKHNEGQYDNYIFVLIPTKKTSNEFISF